MIVAFIEVYFAFGECVCGAHDLFSCLVNVMVLRLHYMQHMCQAIMAFLSHNTCLK